MYYNFDHYVYVDEAIVGKELFNEQNFVKQYVEDDSCDCTVSEGEIMIEASVKLSSSYALKREHR